MAWSPNGHVLATGSVASPTKNTVQLWDPARLAPLGRHRTSYSSGKFYNLGWSRTGSHLVGGSTDYTEWGSGGRMIINTGACASCTPAWGFAWAPDGSRWATGDESGYVNVYSAKGSELASMRHNFGDVNVLAWSADGTTLAGGNTLWFMGRGGDIVPRGTLPLAGYVSDLAWDPVRLILAACAAGASTVSLFAANGQILGRLRLGAKIVSSLPAAVLAWSPDGSTLATAAGKSVRLWALGVWAREVAQG